MFAFDVVFATLTVLLGLALVALFVLATHRFMGHQGPQVRKGLALARRFIGWAWSLFTRTVTNLLSALGRPVRFLAKMLTRFLKWLWASIRRRASGWWDDRKKRIKWLGKGLFWVGVLLIGGTALFSHLYPNPDLNELKLYLYALIVVATVIWLNRWLVKRE